MKERYFPMQVVTLACAGFFLVFFYNQASGQETLKTVPAEHQTPVTSADQPPPEAKVEPTVMPQHTLAIAKTGNGQGRVINNPAGTIFKKGTPVNLQAMPDANSVFDGWSGSCSGSLRTCSLNMNGDRAVTASFSVKTYSIHVRSPVNGVIHPSGKVAATHGGKRRFQIIPLPGYRVSEVLVDKVSVGATNSYTFDNVTGDHTLEVVFVKQ